MRTEVYRSGSNIAVSEDGKSKKFIHGQADKKKKDDLGISYYEFRRKTAQTRAKTFELARTVAGILAAHEVMPEQFANIHHDPIIARRRKYMLFRDDVIIGYRKTSEVVATGWGLHKVLINDGEHSSLYRILLLQEDGSMATVDERHSQIMRNGYFGKKPVDPEFNYNLDRRYILGEDATTLQVELYVQQQLGGLLVANSIEQ